MSLEVLLGANHRVTYSPPWELISGNAPQRRKIVALDQPAQ